MEAKDAAKCLEKLDTAAAHKIIDNFSASAHGFDNVVVVFMTYMDMELNLECSFVDGEAGACSV